MLRGGRSATSWARVYGESGPNFTVDLLVGIIVVGPKRSEPGNRSGRLPPAALLFLEEGSTARRDRWIACHWPALSAR